MFFCKKVPPSGFEPENLGRNELYSVGFPNNLGPSHRESISFSHCKYTNLFIKNKIFFKKITINYL